MKKIINTITLALPLSLFLMIAASSCNKELPVATPIEIDPQLGNTIGDILNSNPDFTILKAAVIKAGMMDAVSSRTSQFTVFAPNNAAFIASGIPSQAIEVLPAPLLASIIKYHIIPGQKILSAGIPTTFPNVQMPTSFIIPAPNTNPLVRFSNFPSRRGASVWVNNIPVVVPDIPAANGVIHVVARVVAPPSRVLLDTLARDPNMQYLVAAVLAADAGIPAGSRFQDYLANPLANFTVMAPTNQAFMNLFAYLSLPVSPTTFALLPVNTVRGIVAYHLLLGRAFAANLPTTPTPVPSLLSASFPGAPTLTFDATQGVKGFKNPIYSNITGIDRHAINGVYHIIDQVLLPQ